MLLARNQLLFKKGKICLSLLLAVNTHEDHSVFNLGYENCVLVPFSGSMCFQGCYNRLFLSLYRKGFKCMT